MSKKETNKEIVLIDYSEYLDNDAVNSLYKERMDNEGDSLDYNELIDSSEKLAKSKAFESVFITDKDKD